MAGEKAWDTGHQWIFSEQALARVREEAQERAAQALRCCGVGPREPPRLLSLEEGATLVLFYAQKLLDLCSLCEAPSEVRWTAMMFYRRFFVARSAMEFDPVPTMFACVHVACKSEEAHEITLDKLLESGGCGADEALKAKVAALELPVLEGIGFSLLVEPQPGTALRMLVEELRHLLAEGPSRGRSLVPAPDEVAWNAVVAKAEKVTFDLSARTDALLRWPASVVIAAALSSALDEHFGRPAADCGDGSAPSDVLASLLEANLEAEAQRSAVRGMVEDVLRCVQRLAMEEDISECAVKDAARVARRWHKFFERLREEASERHEAHRQERKRRKGEIKGALQRQVPTPMCQDLTDLRRPLAASVDGTEDFVIHRRGEDMDDED